MVLFIKYGDFGEILQKNGKKRKNHWNFYFCTLYVNNDPVPGEV